MKKPEVLIVGGGLAGLCCARRLQQSGVSFQIVEAADAVGGRARTDNVDGFLLDRGFQVLLTAYPEARDVLDYGKLNLARFEPGALIRYRGSFHRFADPWRRPRHLLATAISPVASLGDKLRVARLRRRVCRGTLTELHERPETTTLAQLHNEGFSERIIERFFRPFLGGVFLESGLNTSSRKFEFVFRMFSLGDAAVPAKGMGAMAQQLADGLPPESVRTGARVVHLEPNRIRLESGEVLTAPVVVVACEEPAAAKLLGESGAVHANSVTCFFFAADKAPIEEPILVLNGEGQGPINNLCVPSQVSSDYAPPGKSLVSVSVLGVVPDDREGDLYNQVVEQLQDWFGSAVAQWRPLKTYKIPYALPIQNPPALSPVAKPAMRQDGIFVCGDYLDTASIQGAMLSGRRAAECVAASKSGSTIQTT
jgi:protoporphyrinogen oxidase